MATVGQPRGGRAVARPRSAASASPSRSASTARSPQPAARVAAANDPGATTVSASSSPPPPRANSSSASTYRASCTRVELVERRVTTGVERDLVVEMCVGDPGERGFHPSDAFGMAASGVVRVRTGRDDDEQARRYRVGFSWWQG